MCTFREIKQEGLSGRFPQYFCSPSRTISELIFSQFLKRNLSIQRYLPVGWQTVSPPLPHPKCNLVQPVFRYIKGPGNPLISLLPAGSAHDIQLYIFNGSGLHSRIPIGIQTNRGIALDNPSPFRLKLYDFAFRITFFIISESDGFIVRYRVRRLYRDLCNCNGLIDIIHSNRVHSLVKKEAKRHGIHSIAVRQVK